MKTMIKSQCKESRKPFVFGYYLRLFFLVLTFWPIVLTLTLIKRISYYLMKICLSRGIKKEPIRFIRSPSVKEIDDWNYEDLDEQKKTEEWLKRFDDPQVLESARWFCEYNFDLKPNPQIPYNEYDDPLY